MNTDFFCCAEIGLAEARKNERKIRWERAGKQLKKAGKL
jgi:hypothetical protein